jgi:hypothetical protein
VVGVTLLNLKAALRKGCAPRKILATNLSGDYIQSMISSKTIDVIPTEVAYVEQTIKS